MLLGQGFISVLLPRSFCSMVAALDMVWLIEKTGLILIYRQPLRVLESKGFCPKSWHHVTRAIQISLDTLHAFCGEIQLWEAEFLIQASNREV